MIGGGGAATWDAIYALDKKLEINADPWWIEQVAGSTGYGIDVTRNLASGATAQAIMRIANLNASDDQPALELTNAGTGPALLATSGLFVLLDALPASSSPGGITRHLYQNVTAGVITHANAVSTARWADVTSGGMDGSAVQETVGDVIVMTGDAADNASGTDAHLIGQVFTYGGDGGATVPAITTAMRVGTGWDIALDTRSGLHLTDYTSPAFTGTTAEQYLHHLATTTSGGLAPTGAGTALFASHTADMYGHASDNTQGAQIGFRALHDGVGNATKIAFAGAAIGVFPVPESTWDSAFYGSGRDGMYVFAKRSDTGPAGYDTSVGRFDHINTGAGVQGTVKNVWSRVEVPAASTGNFYGFVAETTADLLNAANSVAFWARNTGEWQHAFKSDIGLVEMEHVWQPLSGAVVDYYVSAQMTSGGLTGATTTPKISVFRAKAIGDGSDASTSEMHGFLADDDSGSAGSAIRYAYKALTGWDYSLWADSGLLHLEETSPAISSATQWDHAFIQTTSGNLTHASAIMNGAYIRVIPGTDTAGFLQGLQIESSGPSAGNSLSLGLAIGDPITATSNFDVSFAAFAPGIIESTIAATVTGVFNLESQITQTNPLTSSGQSRGAYYGRGTPDGADTNGFYYGASMDLQAAAGSATTVAYDATGLVGWDYSFRSASGKASFAVSTTFADAVLELIQNDTDQQFINYSGALASNQGSSIADSSVNGDAGVTGPQSKGGQTYGWEYAGMVRINVNGTDYWMPFYSESP